MNLQSYVTMKAVLTLKSGLHIGTGEKVERGEPLPIIESMRTRLPYLPGSSLKGKMRCLLELAFGRQKTDPKDPGSPCWCGQCQICLLFGSGSAASTKEPTRLIFRDCHLSKESQDLLEKIELEEKPGVRIDRVTGKAATGALFPMKRIPEGCEFDLQISIRVFEEDEIQAIQKWLLAGLFLLEKDALGGGGTRGSGHIEFRDVSFDEQPVETDWRDICKRDHQHLTKVNIRSK